MGKEYINSKKFEKGNLYEGSPEKTVILGCISSMLDLTSKDLIENYPDQISRLVNEIWMDDTIWDEFDTRISESIIESGFTQELKEREDYEILSKTKFFEEFCDDWTMVDSNDEVFLISEKGTDEKAVLSVFDDEVGTFFLDLVIVKKLSLQSEEDISKITGNSYISSTLIKIYGEDLVENIDSDPLTFIATKEEGIFDLVASSMIPYTRGDAFKWMNSDTLIEEAKEMMAKLEEA